MTNTKLNSSDIKEATKNLNNWEILEERLQKQYTFSNFREALDFTNLVGELAEAENHHPDIYLAWGKVKIVLWTHSVGGLTQNDFKLAQKIDAL